MLAIVASASASVVASPPRCDAILRTLFGTGGAQPIDAAAIAAACSDTVVWNDMGLQEPLRGRAAVQTHLEALYPPGSLLAVERLADGATSGGFCWHREAEGMEGQLGLRGVTFAELDGDGKLAYVQEGYEPLFKLDTLLEVIFKALAGAAKEGGKAPSYEQATPTDAEGIVRYLWEVAYPGGATPAEALRFFGKDCVYEDFNYREPFVGIGAITDYINLLPEIPNVVFVPEKISEGSTGCAFTWKVVVNDSDGPSGISFKEVDAAGKVVFNRDIPAPAWPRPVGRLAARLRPRLRTFGARS